MQLDRVMQQVISRLQPDFKVTTQPWLSARLSVGVYMPGIGNIFKQTGVLLWLGLPQRL